MPFPVELKYIQETENELGVQFPEKFKAKMIKENGGEVMISIIEGDEGYPFRLFPFLDKSDKKRVSRTCNHIGLETKRMRDYVRFPSNGIAIADDGYLGDLLILLPYEEAPQKLKEIIYLWYSDTGVIQEMANSIEDLKEFRID